MSPSRRWVRAGIAAGLVAVGLYLVAVFHAGSGIPRGTTIMGLDVGGMSPASAAAKLDTGLGAKANGPITVHIGSQTFSVKAQDAGLSVDIPATVDMVNKRHLNPFRVIPALFGARQVVKPKTMTDDAALQVAVRKLAKRVDQKVREGDVAFRAGRAVAVQPRIGRHLDVAAAASRLRAAYLTTEAPVSLPLRTVQPRVTAAEVSREMADFGTPAMSGPVRLELEGKSVSLSPTLISAHLTTAPDAAGKLVPKLDGAELKRAISGRLAPLEQEPKDATFTVTGGKVSVVASKPGRIVTATDLAKAVLGALPKTSGRVVELELAASDAELTTEKARALGITEVMSTFTTHYPYAAYRLQNIHRAADLVRGSVIMPGKTWSLNRKVGERTAENGFAKGFIIDHGRFAVDYGGGTSQVATTTFNAAFFAGLKIVEHKAHSFYISRYPEGREATVVWPAVDLRIYNNSGRPVYVDTSYTASTVTVRVLGTKKWLIDTTKSARYNVKSPKTVYDTSSTCEKQAPVEGFDIDVWRIFKNPTSGRQTRREKFHTHYNPADNVVCGARPGAPQTISD